MRVSFCLDLLRGQDAVCLGLALWLPLAGHFFASSDQNVQVQLAGGIHVELGSFPELKLRIHSTFQT